MRGLAKPGPLPASPNSERKEFNMKLTMILGICALSATLLWGQDQNANKAKINLEEEEVALMDNGKVISTQYVSRGGPEKQAVTQKVKGKILKKLGVTKYDELAGKNLRGKFKEEWMKHIKVESLKHPRLRFIDINGKFKKELLLGNNVSITTHTDSSGQETSFKTVIGREAVVSKNQQYALYSESYADSNTFPGETGKVKYFDVNGNVIWEKQYPKFKIGSGIMSDDGSLLFLIEAWTGNWPTDAPYYQFVAYNKTGKTLFAFPKTKEEEETNEIKGDIKTSPMGRYTAVEAYNKGKNPALVFFDVDNKSFWIYDEQGAVVYDISDEGVCRLGLYTDLNTKIVDLKNEKFIPLK